jgi:hypothetical protein
MAEFLKEGSGKNREGKMKKEIIQVRIRVGGMISVERGII